LKHFLKNPLFSGFFYVRNVVFEAVAVRIDMRVIDGRPPFTAKVITGRICRRCSMKKLYFIVVTLFMCTLAFAGVTQAADSEAGRIAATHAEDQPLATPVATTAPAQLVDGREAIYTKQDGQEIKGWLSWPAGKPMTGLPGVIVIHEWWGLNDNIRQTSERLAAEGYVTLAVDLYRGESADTPKTAMKLMQSLNADADVGRENLAAAYEYLHEGMGLEKVGVVGWCLGGRWSLQAALRLPDDIDASVIYYGGVTDDKAQLDRLQMPILGHFAAKDPIVPPDTVIAFRAALDDLGKDANIYIYPNTKHAFSNPSGMAYNKEAAELAWERTVSFLGENLQ
jgi:carboxymethylenebutenolidase